MMKKNLKHVAAIVLLVGFAALALGSMGSSPSSGGGSSKYDINGGKGTCSRNFQYYINADNTNYIRCGRSHCPSSPTGRINNVHRARSTSSRISDVSILCNVPRKDVIGGIGRFGVRFCINSDRSEPIVCCSTIGFKVW